MTFGARLVAARAQRGPLCVGIDPHAALLEQWGLPDDPCGLERFSMSAVEALGGEVSVLKPQSAFFERHGSAGVAVLERTIAAARELGALVLLDVKRGDIGSTAQGYADAYLDPRSPLASDAMTASPYLGVGSLAPLLATADRHQAGVFVLALTSNPEGPQVQHARTAAGPTVAATVLRALAQRNAGAAPLGSHGAVVGATIEAPEAVADWTLEINGPLLVPGVGAQGGTVESVRRIFGSAMRQVIPSTSREVLGVGPDASALREAAARANDDFATLL